MWGTTVIRLNNHWKEARSTKRFERRKKRTFFVIQKLDEHHSWSDSNEYFLLLNLIGLEPEQKIRKATPAEPEFLFLQTFEKHYTPAVDYWTHPLANRSPKYDGMVSSYITKLVRKAKYSLKALCFDPKDPISIIGFLTAFEHACDTEKIHEEVAMWVLLQYVKKTLANTLNCRMWADDCLSPFAAPMRNDQPRSRKLIPFYLEIVINL